MLDCSNMTHEEYYRVNGALSPARTEQVLDSLLQLDCIEEARGYTTDARSGYLEEDFLKEQLDDLRALTKNLRGANRFDLTRIIQHIEESILEEVRNGEYGAECLRNIEKALN